MQVSLEAAEADASFRDQVLTRCDAIHSGALPKAEAKALEGVEVRMPLFGDQTTFNRNCSRVVGGIGQLKPKHTRPTRT